MGRCATKYLSVRSANFHAERERESARAKIGVQRAERSPAMVGRFPSDNVRWLV